jgi:predicted nuclease with RNAse H fold
MAGKRSPQGFPWYDDVLTGYLSGQPPDTAVAVDAPLTLPVCLRCERSLCPGAGQCEEPAVKWLVQRTAVGRRRSRKPAVTPYTQRVTEVYLSSRYGVPPREAMGQSMGPVTARAVHLLKRLRPKFELNENLIEVYPKATLHILFGRRCAESYRKHARIWEARASILENLSRWIDFEVWRETVLRNTNVFDAVICAVTGMLWASEGWTMPPGLRELGVADGWIWTPGGKVVQVDGKEERLTADVE